MPLDPENRLLWSIPRKRLPVEMWRDAMLAATGNLDQRIGGAPQAVDAADNHRRTLYSLIARRELHQMLRLYDFPEPTAHSPKREPTTTPLQQLFVLNGPLVREQSRVLAKRLIADSPDNAGRVRAAYARLLGRSPSASEAVLAMEFLADARQSGDATGEQVLRQFVHVLLGVNEFLYLD